MNAIPSRTLIMFQADVVSTMLAENEVLSTFLALATKRKNALVRFKSRRLHHN